MTLGYTAFSCDQAICHVFTIQQSCIVVSEVQKKRKGKNYRIVLGEKIEIKHKEQIFEWLTETWCLKYFLCF